MDQLEPASRADEQSDQAVGFFPEWGRRWPLWGVGRRGLPGIDDDLANRLRAWCDVWQTELDPIFEVKWKDPHRGREWIREGYALVAEVQDAVKDQGIRIVPDFEVYAPPALD